MRYERRVHEHLSLLTLGSENVHLQLGPWIEFNDRTGKRWCQPDAILTDRKQGFHIIYEIKYQHTSDAWWQLRWLYEPVLQVILPGRIGLMEICHWHDPATIFPEPYDLTKDALIIPHANRVSVHIWNPGRKGRS